MDEKWSKPQEVVFFPATFTAAAPVKLSFTVLSASDGLKAPTPNPVTFDDAGEQHDVPFSIMTPFHNGYVQESGKVVYRATPSDGSAPLEFAVTVHTKGFYAPGPALLPLLGALALSAFVVGRRLR